MGFKDLFKGTSDGIAYEPTRFGFRPMMKNGKPVLLSELTPAQRLAAGGQSTKPAPRAERKQRKEWGR